VARLQFGDFPGAEGLDLEAQGWRTIRSPAGRRVYWLAGLAGLALFSGLCLLLSLWSLAVGDRGGYATMSESATPWRAMLIVLVAYIPLHELLHLLGQPGWGRSEQSVVVLWPARLRFGVYYEGCMSRRRWLAMRLAPTLVLSVLPVALLALMKLWPYSVEVEIGLQVLFLVNALGSGGDVIAALLVLRKVPPAGQLCFRAGRAYWRPA
jgi:hypothetical protein